MFRAVSPSIIRSSELYIQRQAYVRQILLSACQQAGRSICLTYACRCMYNSELLMMDGETARNMWSVMQKINNLRNWCILLVLL
jgi:hypothetical protein